MLSLPPLTIHRFGARAILLTILLIVPATRSILPGFVPRLPQFCLLLVVRLLATSFSLPLATIVVSGAHGATADIIATTNPIDIGFDGARSTLYTGNSRDRYQGLEVLCGVRPGRKTDSADHDQRETDDDSGGNTAN